jgi:hypothetical protein
MYKPAPCGVFLLPETGTYVNKKGKIFYVHMQTADSDPISNWVIVGER